VTRVRPLAAEASRRLGTTLRSKLTRRIAAMALTLLVTSFLVYSSLYLARATR